MKSIAHINPLVRATVVIGAVASLVTGVTFAALQSQATLTDSSISSATASLQLWDGDSFENTAPGFTVTGLVPGTGSGDKLFYFKSGADLALDVTAHVPSAPPAPVGGYGFSGWENLKVTFTNRSNNAVVNTNLQALLAGEVALPGPALPAGAQGNDAVGAEATPGNYAVEFDIDPSAVSGDHAGVGNFNIVFTGTQPEVEEEV